MGCEPRLARGSPPLAKGRIQRRFEELLVLFRFPGAPAGTACSRPLPAVRRVLGASGCLVRGLDRRNVVLDWRQRLGQEHLATACGRHPAPHGRICRSQGQGCCLARAGCRIPSRVQRPRERPAERGPCSAYPRANSASAVRGSRSLPRSGDFIDRPVKTYSSGMLVRLAFAVAIHVEPEVLLVDEALAVGDYCFRQRCLRKVHELRKRRVTILFVSHAMADVQALGTRALWLDSRPRRGARRA